jgi:ankyrin repeat protein
MENYNNHPLDWGNTSTYQTMLGHDAIVVQERMYQRVLTDPTALNVFIEAVADHRWATSNPKLCLKAISLLPASLSEARMHLLAALERTQVFRSHLPSPLLTTFVAETCKAKDWQLLLQLTPLFPVEMRTPILHLACQYLAPRDIVEKLIDLGCDIHAKNKNNDQALNRAALYGNTEAIHVLLSREAQLENPGREDQTPLFNAVESAVWDKSTLSLELLLAAGANPNVIDAQGKSLIHFCITLLSLCKDSEHILLTTLARLGISIDLPNKDGKTGLESIISDFGSSNLIKPISLFRELIALGANTRLRNDKGEGFLHQIASQSHSWDVDLLYIVVDTLLSSGLEIEGRDYAGNTPLLTAHLNNKREMVKLLEYRGADIHAKNAAGQTPYRLMMSHSVDTMTQATFATQLMLPSSSVWTHHAPGADAVTMAFNKEQCHRVLSDIRNLHAMFASNDTGLKVSFNPFANMMQPLNYAKARKLQGYLKALLGIDLVLDESKKIIEPRILNPHLHDIHLHYPLKNITRSFMPLPGLLFADSKDARLIKLLGIHSSARFYSVDDEKNYIRFVSSWGVSVMLGLRDFAIASESFTVVNELLKILVLAYEGIIDVKHHPSGEIELSILDQEKFGGPLECIVNTLVRRYGSRIHTTNDAMKSLSSSSSTSERCVNVILLRPPASPDEFTDFRSNDNSCNPLISLIPGSSRNLHRPRSAASSAPQDRHQKTD